MSRRVFVVALDANDPASDPRLFRTALKNNPDIENWWNYIPFVYLVTSERDSDEIGVSLHQRSGIRRFFVMQVNPAESEGLLPEDAWAWIRRQSETASKLHSEQSVTSPAEG